MFQGNCMVSYTVFDEAIRISIMLIHLSALVFFLR